MLATAALGLFGGAALGSAGVLSYAAVQQKNHVDGFKHENVGKGEYASCEEAQNHVITCHDATGKSDTKTAEKLVEAAYVDARPTVAAAKKEAAPYIAIPAVAGALLAAGIYCKWGSSCESTPASTETSNQAVSVPIQTEAQPDNTMPPLVDPETNKQNCCARLFSRRRKQQMGILQEELRKPMLEVVRVATY